MKKRTQYEKDPAGGSNRRGGSGGSGGSSGNGKKEEKRAKSSMWTLFMHADTRDAWLMVLGVVGAVGDGLVIPIMFFITNMILNNLGNGPSASPSLLTARINQSVVYLVYLACCSWVVAFFEGYCWTRTGERQASKMRMQYMKGILRQDVEYFDLEGTSTADVIVRISSDSLLIQNVLSEKVPSFITNIATFIGCYTVGFILLWRLALVASPTVVLLVVPAMVYGKMQMSSARKARAAYSKADAIVEQAVSSIRTVYSFVGEGRTIAGYSAALGGSLKHGLRQGLIKGVAVGGQDITLAIWALLAWYGSRLIMYHGSKGGSVFIVGACINMGGTMLGTGLSNVKYFSDAIAAHERIEEVIRRVPKIDVESVEGEVLERTSGEVEFRGVEFTYPSRPNSPILMGFSLKVPTGATVALVGGSGSGKSTVIALLERLYDPDRGEILLDGVDIRKLVLKWLRSQMALVSQEPTLFSTSIRENVLFGKEDASMEEVVAAAKAANAHDFISQLPQGYETQVGERGAQLSGGQKQRIAIARATIMSPRILLLDEATSALDSGSERLVQEALDRASAGRTTIVVAHRLSTIRNADAVAVVQAGQVVEIGSHDDLMCNTGGPYSTLVHLQQATAKTTATKEEQEQTMGCVSPSPAILDDSVDLSPSQSGTIGGSDSNTNGQRLSQETRSAARVGTNLGDSNELPSVKDVHRPGAGAPSLRRPLSLLNASEWKHALAGCAGAVVFGGTYTLQAFFMGSLLSVYFKNDNSLIARETRNTSFIFLSLSVLSILTGVAQHYGFGAAGEYLTKRVREQMLSKILTFEVGWFDRVENSTGAICSRLNKDAYLLKSLVGDQMSLLVQTLSVVAVAFTVSLVISWRYAVVIIAVQPVLIASYYSREVLLKSMSGRAAKSLADSSKLAAEAVSEISTVAAFSSQDRVLRLYGLALDGPRRESIRQSWIAGLGLGTSQFLVRCTWALTFWYGGRLMSSRDITSKAFFQTYLILLLTARMIAEAGTRTSDLAKGAGAVGSILALLGRATLIEPDDPAGLRPPEKLSGRVELRGVDFAYPSRPEAPVLRAFSLTAEAGRSTAIVGRSGSGKSTVVALVERFYDPTRGCVRIDGVDVRSYRLRSLRRRVALVGQQPALFSGSVRENIAYGAAGEEGEGGATATEAEVEDAARAANAHEFVSRLERGYDTRCGERGVQLSGGQKQRIAIARAVLRDPSVLLLDEATSALDGGSERAVQAALERVMVGRTSIVVAHRLGTVRGCDVIAVMEKGALVEMGTHDSLMEMGSGGCYYELVKLQKGPN